jgi:hypothetical protein
MYWFADFALLFFVLFSVLFTFYKRFRFYCLSYVFSTLYSRPCVARVLGIERNTVFKYSGTRKYSRIYSDGIFVKLLKLITGMDLRLSDKTRNEMMRLQRQHSREINMEPYFDTINDKKMTLLEFEYFLSRILLIETNRIYQVFTKEQNDELIQYSVVIFEVLNGLSGGMIDGFRLMLSNILTLFKISRILKLAPEEKRIMVFGPQLSLVTNFSKMIMRNTGDLSKLEPWNFLDLQTKFFVFEEHPDNYMKHQLVFLDRSTDRSNTIDNKAFGAGRIICPGNKLTIDYIASILRFLQKFSIEINGDAVFEGVRFKNISNKKDIMISFMQK